MGLPRLEDRKIEVQITQVACPRNHLSIQKYCNFLKRADSKLCKIFIQVATGPTPHAWRHRVTTRSPSQVPTPRRIEVQLATGRSLANPR
jgi:hypothetical protein